MGGLVELFRDLGGGKVGFGRIGVRGDGRGDTVIGVMGER